VTFDQDQGCGNAKSDEQITCGRGRREKEGGGKGEEVRGSEGGGSLGLFPGLRGQPQDQTLWGGIWQRGLLIRGRTTTMIMERVLSIVSVERGPRKSRNN